MIRDYTPFISAPLRRHEPQYLIFFVTDRCNARCVMCFNPRGETAEKELTVDEVEKIAKSLPHLIQLTISGGEPFLRDDLPDIVRMFVKHSGVKFVTLPTNAFLTEKVLRSTERMLKENPEARFNFCVSIDDIGERHDKIRMVPGGFERLMGTIKGVGDLKRRYPNIELHTTTVVSAENTDRIIEILEWIDKNIEAEVPEILLVRGEARDPQTKSVDLEAFRKAAAVIEKMTAKRAKGGGFKNKIVTTMTARMTDVMLASVIEDRMVIPCLAGDKLAILRSDGEVYPCEILDSLVPPGKRPPHIKDFVLGSVRESNYDLLSIYRGEKAETVREFIRKRHCHCTFECAIFASLIFNPQQWPGLGVDIIRDWLI